MSSLSYADYLKDDFLKRVEKEDLYAALKKDFDKDILTLLQVTDIKEKWKDIHKNDNVAAPSVNSIIHVVELSDTSIAKVSSVFISNISTYLDSKFPPSNKSSKKLLGSNSLSLPVIGQQVINKAKLLMAEIDGAALAEGDILNGIIEAAKISEERLVEVTLPIIEECTDKHSAVVSSENHQWLPPFSPDSIESIDPKYFLKPDLLIGNAGLFDYKNDSELTGGRLFGIPFKGTYDLLRIMEAKAELSTLAYGKAFMYAQSIAQFLPSNNLIKVSIFDGNVIKLFTFSFRDESFSINQCLITLITLNWGQIGGVSTLSRYLMCSSKDYFMYDYMQRNNYLFSKNPFIARGGYSTVYKVQTVDQNIIYAMKVAGSQTQIDQFARMTDIFDSNNSLKEFIEFPKNMESSLTCFIYISKYISNVEDLNVEKCFSLLYNLHRNKIIHGDSRVPNILRGRSYKFIDLSHVTLEYGTEFILNDWTLLIRSIFEYVGATITEKQMLHTISHYLDSVQSVEDLKNFLISIINLSSGRLRL